MNTQNLNNTQPAANNNIERTVKQFANLTLEDQRTVLKDLVAVLTDAGATVPQGVTRELC